MFKSFLKITDLLDHKRKKRFYLIIFFAVIGSFFEVVSVYSIGPFISLLTNPKIIYENSFLSFIYDYLNMDFNYFVALFGAFLCILVFFSNLLLIFMSWQSHKFGQFTGSYFSQQLFNYYMNKDYLSHKNSNHSFFVKNIIFESRRCADGVVGPFTTLISKSVILFSICISLFFINFLVTLGIFGFLILGYFTLYLIVKRKLAEINEDLSLYEKNKYNIADETFRGIKEVKISLSEKIFKNLYLKYSDKYAYSQSLSQILAQFPRFIFETISIFLIVIFSIAFLFILKDRDFALVLPLLSMYAFAGFKIMPSLQLIYFSIATIRSNQNSIDLIYKDLYDTIKNSKNSNIQELSPISLKDKIYFKKICFKYPENQILQNADIEIKRNEIVGIFGESGSGKSTFIDIFTGLIQIDSGTIEIDGKKTEIFENSNWFKMISYLSQNIFIFDGTLKENIVFNFDRYNNKLQKKKLFEVVNLSNINNLATTNQGFDRQLGYSAGKISGGEKQRIGIARALFKDTPILIFDEPTSSLDEKNEQLFRNTILKIKKNRFIVIISHNRDTLSVCDKIYKMNNGIFELEK